MAEIVTLSSAEIGLLRHMIGYESRHMPKNGKYPAWRNYFAVSYPDSRLERLCFLEICAKQVSELSCDTVCYLTEKGVDLLSEYLGVTVTFQ